MTTTHRRLLGLAILALTVAGCASSGSPSSSPAIGADDATLDCLNMARRFGQTFDGRPQMTIDQDRYQRCLAERRASEQSPPK
jgi:hypothetical protein